MHKLRTSRGWRWAEFFFLITGLVALDSYIWVNANSALNQAYDGWRFDQELAGRPASVPRFLASEFGFGTAPATPVIEEKSADERSGLDQFTPPASKFQNQRPDVMGRIEVPRLNLRAIVREGVDQKTLRKAVGHIPGTAVPGNPGNVALAGHRDTFFRKLRDIRKEDLIRVETLRGSYEYEVESIQIVKPSDVSVLKASSSPSLTLVTCYPFNFVGSAPNRYIVRARQVATVPEAQARPGL